MIKRFVHMLKDIPASSSNWTSTTPTVRRDLPSSIFRKPSGEEAPVSSQTFRIRWAVALSRPPFFMLCNRTVCISRVQHALAALLVRMQKQPRKEMGACLQVRHQLLLSHSNTPIVRLWLRIAPGFMNCSHCDKAGSAL